MWSTSMVLQPSRRATHRYPVPQLAIEVDAARQFGDTGLGPVLMAHPFFEPWGGNPRGSSAYGHPGHGRDRFPRMH